MIARKSLCIRIFIAALVFGGKKLEVSQSGDSYMNCGRVYYGI